MSLQMRLHQSNQSRLLRRDGVGPCTFCGNPVEWFDQYNAKRIPLTPEFPARRVPARYRWHLSGGVAYPGTERFSEYCRVPHPAVCPAVEHEALPRQLDEVRRVLAVRMRERIEQGLFTPYVETPSEKQVREPDPVRPEAGTCTRLLYTSTSSSSCSAWSTSTAKSGCRVGSPPMNCTQRTPQPTARSSTPTQSSRVMAPLFPAGPEAL